MDEYGRARSLGGADDRFRWQADRSILGRYASKCGHTTAGLLAFETPPAAPGGARRQAKGDRITRTWPNGCSAERSTPRTGSAHSAQRNGLRTTTVRASSTRSRSILVHDLHADGAKIAVFWIGDHSLTSDRVDNFLDLDSPVRIVGPDFLDLGLAVIRACQEACAQSRVKISLELALRAFPIRVATMLLPRGDFLVESRRKPGGETLPAWKRFTRDDDGGQFLEAGLVGARMVGQESGWFLA